MQIAEQWLLETLCASTLLLAIVLALREKVRARFGPEASYLMWALPGLRLALPPIPNAWRPTVTAPLELAGGGMASAAAGMGSLQHDAPFGAAASYLPAVAPLLAGTWFVGASALLVWHVACYLRLRRRILERSVELSRVGGVRIVASEDAFGPLAFGVIGRHVAVPTNFLKIYDEDERELVLAHELGHHHRGDLLVNWLALVALAMHWFNPVAWRAFRAFRSDQEMANDAGVLSGRSKVERHVYASAILKAATGGTFSMACNLQTVDDLKERLRVMSRPAASRGSGRSGGLIVATSVIVGLTLTGSGYEAAARRVEHQTSTRFNVDDSRQIAAQTGQIASPPPQRAPRVTARRRSDHAVAPGTKTRQFIVDVTAPQTSRSPATRTCVYDGHGPKEFVIRVPEGSGVTEIKCSFDSEAKVASALLAKLESSKAQLMSLASEHTPISGEAGM